MAGEVEWEQGRGGGVTCASHKGVGECVGEWNLTLWGPFGDPNPHPCYHGGQDRFTLGNVSANHIPNQHRVARGAVSGWAGTHKGKGEHYPYRRQRFFPGLSSEVAPEM